MDSVENLSQRSPVMEPQSRNPREMGRAELEAYLQNTECFPTKVSLLEFARSHDIPVNGRTHRDEIIRLCLRMIHDIPASFAGLRDAERKPKTTRISGADTRKVLENFFIGTKTGERSSGRDLKKIMSALLDSVFNCQDAGLLLAQACGVDSEVLPQVLEACDSSLEAQAHFLALLLDLLRLEAGQREIAHVALHLHTCLGEALRQVAALAQKKGLELCCLVRADAPEYLIGDPDRVRQILINLLENAIETSDSGAVVVEVSKSAVDNQTLIKEEREATPHAVLRFTVRGSGGEEAQVKSGEMKQVGPYKKGNGQLSSRGLRLSLARRLVALMHGQMDSASEDSQEFNCSFAVRFDVNNSNDDESSSQFVDLREHSLLVVEDNEIQRRILDELLTSWGAKVTLAEDGRKAFALLERQPEPDPFTAIILDGQMQDTEEIVSVLHQQTAENAGRVSPIIVMFASAAPMREMERYRELYVTAFLQKPFTPVELSQKLHEALVASLMSPDGEVFDRQALWSLVDGDSALLREVINLFDQDCPRLFFALQHALVAKHGQNVMAGAAALRGVVSVFAASGTLRVLSLIEDLGKRNDFANVQSLLPRLTVELSRLKLALDALEQELPILQPC